MKKGRLKLISYVTAIAMLITVFNIPFLAYAAESSVPAAQNGFGVAIGDHIEGGYTQVTTDGIIIEDLYDENLDDGEGPYHPFEITYGDEDAVPEGLITITSSNAEIAAPVLSKRIYDEAADDYYYEPQNDLVATSKLEVDDEGFTTQYFDLYYTGLGQATITMTFTYPDGETVTMAEFPVIVKGVMIYMDEDRFVYNGNEQTPEITLEDWQGNVVDESNYTITYLGDKKTPGEQEVEISFVAEYTEYQDTLYTYYEIVPKAPTSVKLRLTGHDDIRVSWDKSIGADGYYVYYKKGTGSYQYLKRVTSLYATAKDLTDGAKYYFKVIPYVNVYDEKVTSTSYKTSGYIYTLKKVSTPKLSKSGTKVKVSWTNISGETGYQISRSTKKTGTNIVATYKTTTGKSKTVKATKGKKYYYKVRAYRSYVVDGKTVKVYGPWSSPKAYKR